MAWLVSAAGTFTSAPFADFGAFHPVSEQVEDFLANILEFHPQIHENLSRDTFLFSEQAKQNMLCSHVIVVQIASFLHRVLDDFFGTRGLRQLAYSDHFRSALHELLNFEADFSQIDIEILENVGSDTAPFLD